MADATKVVLEPATAEFLAGLGGPPIYTLTPAEARQVLEAAQAGAVATLPAAIDDLTVPGGPSGEVSVRIIRPLGATGPLPVVLYLHGGGWVLGSAATHDRLVRELANGIEAAVVFPNYTRSPEARYPTALDEVYAVLTWIADQGARHNLDPTRLAIAGDSVGGNLAAATTLLAKERGGPSFRFQVLFYPVTDADFTTGSYEQFAEGYWLTRPAMQWYWDSYLPDTERRREPAAAPLHATIEQLRGLPPALVITGEADVLRDEGEAYAHKLIEAGVRVYGVRYQATIHDFVMLNALAGTPAARAAIASAIRAIRHAFGQ